MLWEADMAVTEFKVTLHVSFVGVIPLLAHGMPLEFQISRRLQLHDI